MIAAWVLFLPVLGAWQRLGRPCAEILAHGVCASVSRLIDGALESVQEAAVSLNFLHES